MTAFFIFFVIILTLVVMALSRSLYNKETSINSLKKELDEIKSVKQSNLEEDLALATSENLFEELKKRKHVSYILIKPNKTTVEKTLIIDIHEMSIEQCLSTLSLAYNLTSSANSVNKNLEEEGEEENYD